MKNITFKSQANMKMRPLRKSAINNEVLQLYYVTVKTKILVPQ